MKKKRSSILVAFAELPQSYTANAEVFDDIRRVWLRYAPTTPLPDTLEMQCSDGGCFDANVLNKDCF